METKSLSIVMPVFNEQNSIEKTISACVVDVTAYFLQSEIVVIDDASTDDSSSIVEQLSINMPDLKLIRNAKNRGHGPSLLRGLQAASGDVILILDSDFQHAPSEFWQLYKDFDEKTIVTGMRHARKDSWFRNVASDVGNGVIRTLFGLKSKDINIPFKIVPAPFLKAFLKAVPKESLVPSAAILLFAHYQDVSVKQTPIQHLPRMQGQSSIPGLRFIGFAWNAMKELSTLRRLFSKLPANK